MAPVLRISALVLALALVAAACGGDDSTDDTTTTTVADDEAALGGGDVGDSGEDDVGDDVGEDDLDEIDDALLEELLGDGLDEDREVVADGVVENGDLVVLHYTGTLDSGDEFDSSVDREPFEFVVGSGQVIPGFDDGVLGMAAGETKTVRIEADDAYGQPDPDAVVPFPIEEVPEEFRVEGMEVVMGNGQPATVVEVTEDTVTVDVNHPLAGEALTFDLEVIEIRR